MTEYLIIGPNAWGKADTKAKAFERMARNISASRVEGKGEITIGVIEGEGLAMDGMGYWDADEVDSETELTIQSGDLVTVHDLFNEAVHETHVVLEEADEVEA